MEKNEMPGPKELPVCPSCKRKTIYFRKDGTVRCRACGYCGEMPR